MRRKRLRAYSANVLPGWCRTLSITKNTAAAAKKGTAKRPRIFHGASSAERSECSHTMQYAATNRAASNDASLRLATDVRSIAAGVCWRVIIVRYQTPFTCARDQLDAM